MNSDRRDSSERTFTPEQRCSVSLRSLYRPDSQARDILMINHWQQQTDESIADEGSRAIHSTLTDMALNGAGESPEKSKIAWDLQRISRRHQLPAQEGLHGFPPLKITCSLPTVLGVSPRPLARRSKVLPELPIEQARREGDERVSKKVAQAPGAPMVPERHDSTGSQVSRGRRSAAGQDLRNSHDYDRSTINHLGHNSNTTRNSPRTRSSGDIIPTYINQPDVFPQIPDIDRHRASRVANIAHDDRQDTDYKHNDKYRRLWSAAYHNSNDHQSRYNIMDHTDHHGLANIEHQCHYQY
ncbi:hypothetical protein LTR95_001863 [Oleoguttula sp. CCFEE 5521]